MTYSPETGINTRFDVFAPTGGFIIGRSQIGDALGDYLDRLDWQPIPQVSSFNIARGGTRDGVSSTINVGTMSARFINAADPLDDTIIKPNSLVRATRAASTEFVPSIYPGDPGTLSTDGSVWRLDYDPTYYPVSFYFDAPGIEDGVEYFFEAEIRFVGTSSDPIAQWSGQDFGIASVEAPITSDWTPIAAGPFPYSSSDPLFVSVYDGVGTLDGYVEIMHPRAYAVSDMSTVYTGTVQDVVATYERDGNTYVNVLATDGVQSLANTQRYGAASDGADPYETWANRIRRLASSANTAVLVPDAVSPRVIYRYDPTASGADDWGRFGTLPAHLVASPLESMYFPSDGGVRRGLRHVTSYTEDATVTQSAYSYGVERVVTGLTPGLTYKIYASGIVNYFGDSSAPAEPDAVPDVYAVGVVGESWGTGVELRGEAYPGDFPTYTFVASSTSHTIRVALAESTTRTWYADYVFEYFALLSLRVEEIPPEAYRLQDVVYEGSLLSHFDLACNSVGAAWWVDVNNVVQFKRTLDSSEIVVHFSDIHDADDPTHMCYMAIEMSYDTHTVANDLRVTNHGRVWDAGTSEWVAQDVTYSDTDVTSAATWGKRSVMLDTSLYDASEYAGSVDNRMAEVLADFATPEITVTSLTFDGYVENYPPDLDVNSRVRVTKGTYSETFRVVNMSHDVTPFAWKVTLELVKE